MSEVAQILLLPPPTPLRSTLPAREQTDLAVNADVASGGDNARARRFRFRVYEGGEGGEANARTDTARASAARLALVSGSSGNGEAQADRSRNRTGAGQGATGFTSNPSSAFLAQSIAQEQLGEGLYNPPNQQATIAYTRAATALQPRATAGVNVSA